MPERPAMPPRPEMQMPERPTMPPMPKMGMGDCEAPAVAVEAPQPAGERRAGFEAQAAERQAALQARMDELKQAMEARRAAGNCKQI